MSLNLVHSTSNKSLWDDSDVEEEYSSKTVTNIPVKSKFSQNMLLLNKGDISSARELAYLPDSEDSEYSEDSEDSKDSDIKEKEVSLPPLVIPFKKN
mmetsp:Transcript_16806/g.18719  ORF Transcript_16806/g.18719 Transcript_16806/m.18719 type:complete len:97 (+) Transcript_16806:41-331(+)